MADLTGVFNATNIQKGQDNTVTLSKVDLETIAAGLEQTPYFNDSNNWKQVKGIYITDTGKQVNELLFDATVATPEGNFNPTAEARDTWEIKGIIIFDFDGGFLRINRGDLTVAEFDIDLSGASGILAADLTFNDTVDSVSTFTYSGTGNSATFNKNGVDGWDQAAFTTQTISGDASVTIEATEALSSVMIGFGEDGVLTKDAFGGNPKYGVYLDSGGQAYLCTNGNPQATFELSGGSSTNSWTVGDEFRMEIVSDVFKVYKNDVLIHDAVTATKGNPVSGYPLQLQVQSFESTAEVVVKDITGFSS
jgi:hypothetical protein